MEKSTETAAIMQRSSVKVVRHSYGSSKAISYHPEHADITLPPWPLLPCDTGQREGQWRATVWLNWRKPGINFWWTALMPFRPEPRSYKAFFITRALRGRRNDKAAHLLTRHAAVYAHIYNTRGVPNGSISRQGVWGPQQGPGETPRVKEMVYCFSTC